MKNISRQIGSRIRSLRIRIELTQQAFAQKLGVSDRAISSYELGDSSPSLKNIIRIAKLAQVSIDWLLTGSTMENQKPPESEEVPEDEIRLLIAYRRASIPRKRLILQISETISVPNRTKPEQKADL